jgi:hypothetical protein
MGEVRAFNWAGDIWCGSLFVKCKWDGLNSIGPEHVGCWRSDKRFGAFS